MIAVILLAIILILLMRMESDRQEITRLKREAEKPHTAKGVTVLSSSGLTLFESRFTREQWESLTESEWNFIERAVKAIKHASSSKIPLGECWEAYVRETMMGLIQNGCKLTGPDRDWFLAIYALSENFGHAEIDDFRARAWAEKFEKMGLVIVAGNFVYLTKRGKTLGKRLMEEALK